MLLIFGFMLVFMLIVISFAPLSFEVENEKRVEKGESALTEDMFARKIKRERGLAIVLLSIAYFVAAIIRFNP